jgi:hypothetical protein
MMVELTVIFRRYQTDGEIVFAYDTRVNYGRL